MTNLATPLKDINTNNYLALRIQTFYQDDGEVVNEDFGLNKETLKVLRAKIVAVLLDELPKKEI